jgi:hypothetical protein
MEQVRLSGDAEEREGTPIPPTPDETTAGLSPAWEMIENGRYMPRRIRGSYRGRELG